MIPRSEIVSTSAPALEPPQESRAPEPSLLNYVNTYLPDALALGAAVSLLLLPRDLIHQHYQDPIKFSQEAQSGLFALKIALISNIPSLAFTTFVVMTRLTDPKKRR